MSNFCYFIATWRLRKRPSLINLIAQKVSNSVQCGHQASSPATLHGTTAGAYLSLRHVPRVESFSFNSLETMMMGKSGPTRALVIRYEVTISRGKSPPICPSTYTALIARPASQVGVRPTTMMKLPSQPVLRRCRHLQLGWPR